jgi:hypothetical protein
VGGGGYMRHYSKAEWLWFINNDSGTVLHEEMQEHLLVCDECMMLYLELIDKINMEEVPATEDFTDKVMELVHREKVEAAKRRLNQKRVNTLIYYVSAASLTLLLTGVGTFQDIYKGLSSVEKQAFETPQKQSLFMSGWTDRLTDETSKFLSGVKKE